MNDQEPTNETDPSGVFESTVRDEVCRLRRPGTRWLSTGHDGGESRAEAAYLLSVPDGWDDVDVSDYVQRRRQEAGFAESGPALLTGVSMTHAHRARFGSVEAVVTAGLNNPAALPVAVSENGSATVGTNSHDAVDDGTESGGHDATDRHHTGTVNVVVGTTRSLAPGALANLVAVAAEAKATTLLARTGFPGTTSDAVLVGCDPDGESAAFSGSATPVGSAARVCVRDALLAALDSRYGSEEPPRDVEAAEYGVASDERASVEHIDAGDRG